MDLELMISGAVEARDAKTAATCILATEKSKRLPRLVLEELGRVVFSGENRADDMVWVKAADLMMLEMTDDNR